MKGFFLPHIGISYRINAFRRGRPTLVFIHGLSGSSSAWVHYEKRLQRKYNILTFDLRGHGKSVKPNRYGDYAIKKFVDDIRKLLLHLRITDFILVSHSFGTVIALEFLRQYGNMISQAVFLSPIIDIKKIKGSKILHTVIAGSIKLLSPFPFHPKPGTHIDYAKYEHTGDWNVRRMAADIPNTSLRVYLYCLKHMHHYRHYDFWKRIKIPLLIVHGRKDTLSPVGHSITIAREMKNIKLVILNNADHMLVLNNCREVCDAVETFLGSDAI